MALLARALSLSTLFAALLAGCSARPGPPDAGGQRLVTLSPAITETVFAIGAGEQVVGISDYADWPPEALSRPKVGSALSPNYEAIARLRPTLILDEQAVHAPEGSLPQLAPVKVLPWLKLDEVVGSVRELGRITGQPAKADALAERLRWTLSRPAPKDAPRVLLALGDNPGPLSSVWYMKAHSLHGAALEAAGARNAVSDDAPGPPNLSLEKVLALDPDGVVVLVVADKLDAQEEERYLSSWRELSALRAVKQGHLRLVHGRGVQSTGPRILELVEQLRAAVQSMKGAPASP